MINNRILKINEPYPNCGGVFYNKNTGKCRHCSARAKNGHGKSTQTIDVQPRIKKEKEAIAMAGVWYE